MYLSLDLNGEDDNSDSRKTNANNIIWFNKITTKQDPMPFSIAADPLYHKYLLLGRCVLLHWYDNGTGVLLHETHHKFVKILWFCLFCILLVLRGIKTYMETVGTRQTHRIQEIFCIFNISLVSN